MKRFLGILVLGLLLSSNAYADTVAHCSVASDDADASASSSSSKLDRIYQCANTNTFILDAGEYIGDLSEEGAEARIDMGTATDVTIDNSGTIEARGNGNVITSGASDTIKVTNKSTGVIKGATNGIYVGEGDNWEIDNYGDIYAVAAKAV